MNDLLIEIARCPIATACLAGERNQCSTIVESQQATGERFQLPEPWVGRIESVPILFVSSNPSINEQEEFPIGSWPDERVIDFFHRRFDEETPWMDGLRPLLKDGSYARSITFFSHAGGRAEEILGRPARIGKDFAFTEIVHCKSRGEIGVSEALDVCASRYTQRILENTLAPVLIVFGKPARRVVEHVFPETKVTGRLAGPLFLGGRKRFVAFLPHPNSFVKKTFAACLPDAIDLLREAVRSVQD